ncbi:hypothetical protein QZH41_004373 [Actinostola sp. cb2023]|nr:hypothetical protein QZH41_004373 [Actinostola sp. cb2023]
MRLLVVILAVFLLGVVAAAKPARNEMIDIDVSTLKPSMKKGNSKLSQNSGDDDEDEGSSAVQGDDVSGSGSGQFTTTVRPTKEIEFAFTKVAKTPSTEKPPTVQPTQGTKSIKKPHATEKSTEKVIEVVNNKKTESPSEKVVTIKPTTEPDDDMLGGGVSNDGEVQASIQEREAFSVLTTEVIAAVVVGGVCAIILIAFLVYRLRKRDEGSYILTDTTYKDTNKLRGDPGKEAFV